MKVLPTGVKLGQFTKCKFRVSSIPRVKILMERIGS